MTEYDVGVYIRLSRDSTDYGDGISHSIENQRDILTEFVDRMPCWTLKKIYIDDGASGADFNRPGFIEMMEDVRKGIITLVLVKDLSRFGRNYLEAGRYLEEELPALGCRFAALSDGIDTETGENDILPFLNAVNDYYIKNLSDRVKAVLTAKARDGQWLSGTAPYGYIRDPDNYTRLIRDEYAAGVVRRIFILRAQGTGYTGIASVLNKDGVLPPRLYYYKCQNRETKAALSDIWSDRTIKLILGNEVYIGNTVSHKRAARSYRDKRQVMRCEDEWIRVKNTHVPIVDEGLWQTVQRINSDSKARFEGSAEPRRGLFSGLLICGGCQARMSYASKNGGEYSCRTYRVSGRAVCSRHSISEQRIIELVSDSINEASKSFTFDENRILIRLNKQLDEQQRADKEDRSKKRRTLTRQLSALDREIERHYEQKADGEITGDEFARLLDEYETRRIEIENRLGELKESAVQIDKKFLLRLIREKSVLLQTDKASVMSLIERIEIGERESTEGVTAQNVSIYYK